ncbi:5-formyltetrahydrofolate cyclo-ligase [Sphingomonas sp. MMS24-JH45]
MTDKTRLRAELRAARRRAAGTIPVWPAFAALLAPDMVVASYVPVGGEADPAALERAALAAGCRLALPHVVDRATPLTFLAWDDAMLTDGPFGLRQPAAHHPPLVPDIVLTPLLGFDRRGNRLGQGAGTLRSRLRRLPGGPADRYRARRAGNRPASPRPVGHAASRRRHEPRMDRSMTPEWRKPMGMLVILGIIAVWSVAIISLSATVGGWPWWGQAVFYLVAGIVWVLPLKPLLRWMETGHWR